MADGYSLHTCSWTNLKLLLLRTELLNYSEEECPYFDLSRRWLVGMDTNPLLSTFFWNCDVAQQSITEAKFEIEGGTIMDLGRKDESTQRGPNT